MNILLTRFTSTDYGTFGVLTVDGKKFFTVEKPWVNNTQEISCIPSGVYTLAPHGEYGKDGNVLCMVNNEMGITHYKNVNSKRFACLIHTANYERDVIGCIGLGEKYLGHMVTDSRSSIKEFYGLVDPEETHTLTVEWGERDE